MLVPAAQERRVEHQLLVQRQIGLDPFDDHFGQRDAHFGDRLLARVGPGDHLADQRIVVRRHEIVGVGVRVDADARPARHVELR